MIKYTTNGILLLIGSSLSAQHLVNNGANIRVSTGTTVRIDNGNISNHNNSTIENEGTIYLDGNFDQRTGARYIGAGASWFWFEGNTDQQITGDALVRISRLRVDNGNELQLFQDVQSAQAVDLMNNGSIRLHTANLITNNGVISNYDLSHYIITNSTGTLRSTMSSGDIKTFPVGNSTFNPATLFNAGMDDDFLVRVEDIVYDQGTSGTPEIIDIVNRTWHIGEAAAGGSIVDITVEWDEAQELAGFDRTACGVAHWDGSQWDHPSSVANADAVAATRWSSTRFAQTSFSPFVVEDLDLELPVGFLSFDAHRSRIDQVDLYWATATEINNRGFELERKLEHETEFKTVGFVPAHGNSSSTQHYSFVDENAYPHVSYYRLRQIDLDGSTQYHPQIRAVKGWTNTETDTSPVLYPNPVTDLLHLRFGNLSTAVATARIRILDMRGVPVQDFRTPVAAYQVVHLDTQALPAATYLLEIRLDTGEQQILRFIHN